MKRNQTVTDAAAEIGCDEKTIRRHCGNKERPAPHTRLKNGQLRVDAGELTAWGKANNINFQPGRPTDTPDSPDLEAARLRKENALAARWELHVAKERAVLVPAEEVEQVWGELRERVRAKLLGFPAGAAPQCEGHDAPTIQGILESKITEILIEFAGND